MWQKDTFASAPSELVLHYRNVDGVRVRTLLPLMSALFTALPLWLLFLCVNQLRILAGLGARHFTELQLVIDPPSHWHVIWSGVVLLPVTLYLSWVTALISVRSWRMVRGSWWLRLTDKGFSVNDYVFRTRRYAWRDIEEFALVGHAGEDAPGYVGVHLVPDYRRTFGHRLRKATTPGDREGRKPDSLVMGYWDRPVDEAVGLMNEWRTRYRAA